MSKKVRFTKDTKLWDGINIYSKSFLKFVYYFSKFPVETINPIMVKHFTISLSNKHVTTRQLLDEFFCEISIIIKKIKFSDRPIPLLRKGGRINKLFVAKNSLKFFDHLENILIDLLFV